MVKMKEIVCCKEVLHQAGKDVAVQSRHKEVEAAEEIIKIFLSVFGINYPESVHGLGICSVVTDKNMMNMQVKVLPGSEQGAWECRATHWCKVGVSIVAAARVHSEPPTAKHS